MQVGSYTRIDFSSADTLTYITWLPRDVEQLGKGTALDPRRLGNVTGTVDMPAYVNWLRENGYEL